mgnify:FL=1
MQARKSEGVDRVLLIYFSVIVVLGLAALFSASTPVGFAKFGDAWFFVKRQVLFGIIPGVIFAVIFSYLRLDLLKKFSWAIYAASIVFLLLVFIPGIGVMINSSRSWVNILGFTFQPAEFSKLAVVVILAHLLSQKKYDWEDWQRSIVPVLAILSPTLILILLQPDIGTLSIIIAEITVMLFVAMVPFRYLTIMGLVGVVAFVGLVSAAPYRVQRITTFLHPELDPMGQGYQMNQAFLAVGSGGFWGRGFGQSRQKYQYLPEVSADTIFAVIAEENGFLVSSALVVLILLIVWRGLKISLASEDPFGALLAAGIMIWFGWQSYLNIGATVGALPLTGVPLPFVSHGGSAMVMALSGAGIVLNISRKSNI